MPLPKEPSKIKGDDPRKVICVNARRIDGWGNVGVELLTEGAEYTVREQNRAGGLRLWEVMNGDEDHFYHRRRFKVVRKTDITVFQEMLKNIPKTAPNSPKSPEKVKEKELEPAK